MTERKQAQIVHPTHCKASGSPDRTKLALTFLSQDHEPITLVLPVAGAVGLQRKLAQSLYLLTAKAREAKANEPLKEVVAPA
jgi:hypothetical protein